MSETNELIGIPTSEEELVASICKDSFEEFVREFWEEVPGAGQLVWNWHMGVICKELQDIAERVFQNQPRPYDFVTNISPGTSKPVWEESRVMLGYREWKKLKHIQVGEYVIGKSGQPCKVLATHDQREQECVRLETLSGHELIAAKDHPVLTAKGWKNAGAIWEGETLGLMPSSRVRDSKEMVAKGLPDQMIGSKVTRSKEVGKLSCRCLTVEEDQSFVAEGFVVHNSTLASILFHPWTWTKFPQARHITGSHTETLVHDLAHKSKSVIQSEKYQRCFPHVVLRSSATHYYQNTLGGDRLTCTIGGKSPTGFHAHFITIDDPIDPQKAISAAELKTAGEFMTNVLPTRKVNKEVSVMILIMQRLHELDPTGVLLSKAKLEGGTPIRRLCLPAELTEDVSPPGLKDLYINGLMDPRRLPRNVLKSFQVTLGQYGYSGQFMQSPVPLGGSMFRLEYFNRRSKAATFDSYRIRYWDRACVISGVEVSTINGPIKVEDIQAGDLVLTREGYKKVKWAGITKRVTELVSVEFANGSIVTGTPDHPVWTNNRGWVDLAAVRSGDRVVTDKGEIPCRRSKVKLSNSKGLSIGDNPEVTISRRCDGTKSENDITPIHFIGPFGDTITETFPTVTTFITKTEIGTTTKSIIWSVSQERNTTKSMVRLQNGTKRKRRRNIGKNWEEPYGQGQSIESSDARNAESISDQTILTLTESNSVPSFVGSDFGTGLVQESVRFAKKNSGDDREQKLASESVPMSFGRELVLNAKKCLRRNHKNKYVARVVAELNGNGSIPVYDLTVEDCPEFFANGILVHNSTEDGGCYTAGVLLSKDRDGLYFVEHVVHGQWEPDQRNKIMRATALKDRARYSPKHEPVIYVEAEGGSSGRDAWKGVVRALEGFVVREDRVTGKKEVRAEPWSSQLAAGNVVLVEDGCLRKGTLVTTSLGQVPIEKVKIGDLVLTRNGYRKVLKSGPTKKVSHVFRLGFEDSQGNTVTIEGTNDHKIWNATLSRWVPMEEFSFKHEVLTSSGKRMVCFRRSWGTVTGNSRVHHDEEEFVYDISVEGNPEFFANGILVHNSWDINNYIQEHCQFPLGRFKDQVDASCLRGVEISTINGPVMIENIREGDLVLTRQGYKKVLWSGQSGTVRTLCTVLFSDGIVLVGTPDHRILTQGRGFIEFRELTGGDFVLREESWCTRNERSSQIPKLSSSTELDSFGENTRSISGGMSGTNPNKKKPTCLCTLPYGDITTETFPLAVSFTTWTKTGPITQLKIFNVSLEKNTEEYTPIAGKLLNNWNIWLQSEDWLRNGTVVTRVGNGTKNTERIHGKEGPNTIVDVFSVTRNLNPEQRLNPSSVLGVATESLGGSQTGQKITNPNVSGVRNDLNTSGELNSSVQSLAVPEEVKFPVYDLNVEDCHEFFANGILVHNSGAFNLHVGAARQAPALRVFSINKPRTKGMRIMVCNREELVQTVIDHETSIFISIQDPAPVGSGVVPPFNLGKNIGTMVIQFADIQPSTFQEDWEKEVYPYQKPPSSLVMSRDDGKRIWSFFLRNLGVELVVIQDDGDGRALSVARAICDVLRLDKNSAIFSPGSDDNRCAGEIPNPHVYETMKSTRGMVL